MKNKKVNVSRFANGKNAVEVDFHGAADKLRLHILILYDKH